MAEVQENISSFANNQDRALVVIEDQKLNQLREVIREVEEISHQASVLPQQNASPVNLQLKPLKYPPQFSKEIKQVNEHPIVAMDNGKVQIQNTKLQMTGFTDYELEQAKSQKTRAMEREIQAIQDRKVQTKSKPLYIEQPKLCKIKITPQDQQPMNVMKNLIGECGRKKLRRPTSADGSSNLLSHADIMARQTKSPQPTAFNGMTIDELMQHGCGIMDLFENQVNLQRYAAQHNQQPNKRGKYVRLQRNEYSNIFHTDPTFNEKRAFVNIFRQKWKQEQKLTSVFDRIQNYKQARVANEEEENRKLKNEGDLRKRVTDKIQKKKIFQQSEEVQEQQPKPKIHLQLSETDPNDDFVGNVPSWTHLQTQKNIQLLDLLARDEIEPKNHIFMTQKRYEAEQKVNQISSKSNDLAKALVAIQEQVRLAKTPKGDGFNPPQPYLTPEQSYMSALELAGIQTQLHEKLQSKNQDQLNYFVTEMYNRGFDNKVAGLEPQTANLIKNTSINDTAYQPDDMQDVIQEEDFKHEPCLSTNPQYHPQEDQNGSRNQFLKLENRDHVLTGSQLTQMQEYQNLTGQHKQQLAIEKQRSMTLLGGTALIAKQQTEFRSPTTAGMGQKAVVNLGQSQLSGVMRQNGVGQNTKNNNINNNNDGRVLDSIHAQGSQSKKLFKPDSKDSLASSQNLKAQTQQKSLLAGETEGIHEDISEKDRQNHPLEKAPLFNCNMYLKTQKTSQNRILSAQERRRHQEPRNQISVKVPQQTENQTFSQEDRGRHTDASHSKISQISVIKLHGKHLFQAELEHTGMEQAAYDHDHSSPKQKPQQNNSDDKEQKNVEQIPTNETIKPSVYNLPLNPMNQKSYQYNFIKSRVEKSRVQTTNDNQKQAFINKQSDNTSKYLLPKPNAYVKNTKNIQYRQRMALGAEMIKKTKDAGFMDKMVSEYKSNQQNIRNLRQQERHTNAQLLNQKVESKPKNADLPNTILQQQRPSKLNFNSSDNISNPNPNKQAVVYRAFYEPASPGTDYTPSECTRIAPALQQSGSLRHSYEIGTHNMNLTQGHHHHRFGCRLHSNNQINTMMHQTQRTDGQNNQSPFKANSILEVSTIGNNEPQNVNLTSPPPPNAAATSGVNIQNIKNNQFQCSGKGMSRVKSAMPNARQNRMQRIHTDKLKPDGFTARFDNIQNYQLYNTQQAHGKMHQMHVRGQHTCQLHQNLDAPISSTSSNHNHNKDLQFQGLISPDQIIRNNLIAEGSKTTEQNPSSTSGQALQHKKSSGSRQERTNNNGADSNNNNFNNRRVLRQVIAPQYNNDVKRNTEGSQNGNNNHNNTANAGKGSVCGNTTSYIAMEDMGGVPANASDIYDSIKVNIYGRQGTGNLIKTTSGEGDCDGDAGLSDANGLDFSKGQGSLYQKNTNISGVRGYNKSTEQVMRSSQQQKTNNQQSGTVRNSGHQHSFSVGKFV